MPVLFSNAVGEQKTVVVERGYTLTTVVTMFSSKGLGDITESAVTFLKVLTWDIIYNILSSF